MIKVIDNFLPQDEFKYIQDSILSDHFPFYFNESITSDKDPKDYYYFTHTFFYDNKPQSNWFVLWENFLKKIECRSLIRIKASMYMNLKNKRKNKPHVDYTFEHKGCLFYINTNNGATFFEKEKVLPKENRVVFFQPHKLHSSSLCTDQKRRLVINFNYF
tara:strand:+ start:76 stop:555 length:480 start_codon:yes stop_codon:yes gene_type:complete